MQYFIFWSFTTFTAFLNFFELFWTFLHLFTPVLAYIGLFLVYFLTAACLPACSPSACLPGASCPGCPACVQYQITCSLRLALCLASCILHPASCVLRLVCLALCTVCLILRSVCCGESRVRAVWLHLPYQVDRLAYWLTGWQAGWLTGLLANWLTGWQADIKSCAVHASLAAYLYLHASCASIYIVLYNLVLYIYNIPL